MRLLLASILLLLSFFHSNAQEKEKWERVYTFEDATIAMNTTTVTFAEEGTGSVRFRWNWSKPQPLSDASGTKYKSRVEAIEFDCARRRYRLREFTLFDEKSKSLLTREMEEQPLEWNFLKPGGMMERLFGPACRLIEKKRPRAASYAVVRQNIPFRM